MLDALHEHITDEIKEMSDADLKTQINHTITSTLPRRAKKKRWKVKDPNVFRRAIYDNVFGRPWEQVVNPPAIRNMNRLQMELVLVLARGLFEQKVKIADLLHRSDNMR